MGKRRLNAGYFFAVQDYVHQYPTCYRLIYQLTVLLDSWCLTRAVQAAPKYEIFIIEWYKRVLAAGDEKLSFSAANTLFGSTMRKEQYGRAEQYPSHFSD